MGDTKLVFGNDEGTLLACFCERDPHTILNPCIGLGGLMLFTANIAMGGLPFTRNDQLLNHLLHVPWIKGFSGLHRRILRSCC